MELSRSLNALLKEKKEKKKKKMTLERESEWKKERKKERWRGGRGGERPQGALFFFFLSAVPAIIYARFRAVHG